MDRLYQESRICLNTVEFDLYIYTDAATHTVIMTKRSRQGDFFLRLIGIHCHKIRSSETLSSIVPLQTIYTPLGGLKASAGHTADLLLAKRKLEAAIFIRTLAEIMRQQAKNEYSQEKISRFKFGPQAFQKIFELAQEERQINIGKIDGLIVNFEKNINLMKKTSEIDRYLAELSEYLTLGSYIAVKEG